MKEPALEMEGSVIRVFSNRYDVLLDAGSTVSCVRAGKLRHNKIALLVPDRVRVELSPYDLKQGRVVYRL